MATNNTDYNFNEIELHWQKIWENNATFSAKDFVNKEKYYILDMFPYPSGAGLHIGHPEGYTASDILARYKWSKGFNVLHPMGWDAFGLPAEQYAIKTGTHPAITTKTNIDNFRNQIKRIGFAIDWQREINTTDPQYFKWTQWIFLKLFQKGLAYVDDKPVWWCPALGTVLANEEVIDGKSEVGKHPVERRKLRQWVLKITAYADKLIEGLDGVNWPDSTKRLQANWIGKSQGAKVKFKIENKDETLEVFTTRVDTLFGATYMAIAPEHPLLETLTTPEQKDAVEAYKKEISSKSDLDRTDLAKDKTGVFTGSYAINPINGKKIPIWTADYVLITYGTGAVMAVPAHDDRDFEFAQKFDLPIIRVIEKKDKDGNDIALPFVDVGTMINSQEFDNMPSEQVKEKIIEKLEAQELGTKSVNYKLRDWLFSRQRYWGEPFPILWVEEDVYNIAKSNPMYKDALPAQAITYEDENSKMLYALPLLENQLPLKLPEVEVYQPSGTGESPLINAVEWVNVYINPTSSEVSSTKDSDEFYPAIREVNTMPQWAGSCWYYLRYCDPKNQEALIGKEQEQYWGYPDFYIGGAEHAVLHLLYARFWHKVLYDCGIVKGDEPFTRLFHQGIILGQLEYTALTDKDGKFTNDAQQAKDSVKLSVDEVEKVGANFVLKSDNNIKVDARCYKMSKSRGNVVNPDDIIAEYGADSLRLYEMFLGPLEDQKPWNTNGMEGVFRFLKKIWREYIDKDSNISQKIKVEAKEDAEFVKIFNQTVKKVSSDIENLRMNTAISQMMIFLNSFQKQEVVSKKTAMEFVQLLAPFAPHIAEELWERLGGEGSVTMAKWPEFDESKLTSNTVKMAVQVNGKLRAELLVEKTATKDDVIAEAMNIENVKLHISGKEVVRQIFVPNKIVNIVVK